MNAIRVVLNAMEKIITIVQHVQMVRPLMGSAVELGTISFIITLVWLVVLPITILNQVLMLAK
jgi:hypothetical protein